MQLEIVHADLGRTELLHDLNPLNKTNREVLIRKFQAFVVLDAVLVVLDAVLQGLLTKVTDSSQCLFEHSLG